MPDLTRHPKKIVFALALIALISVLFAPKKYQGGYAFSDDDRNQASEYMAAYFRPLPEDWTWHQFPFGDSQRGHAVRWGVSGPQDADTATIIFVPGYTGTIEMYTDFIHGWRMRGYRVIAMDLPGQGGSSRREDNPEKAWTGNFREFGDVVAAFTQSIVAQSNGQVVLVGESFGGHSVLRAAADHPMDIDALVAVVPALEMQTPGFPRWVANAITSTTTALGFGSRYALTQGNWRPQWGRVDLSNYPCGTREDRIFLQDALFIQNPEFRVGGVTNEWSIGLQRSGKDLATRPRADYFDYPVTMVFATDDEIIDNERAMKACDETLTDCTSVVLQDVGHCLILEPDPVIDQMLDAVAAQIDALPPRLTP